MVAIFTGLGAGFDRGSGSVLGSAGLLGSASTGRGNEQLFVNAATGNLMISQRDEFLVGLGLDASVSRTYNSLGDLSDDNGDNWRFSDDRKGSPHSGERLNLELARLLAGELMNRERALGASETRVSDAEAKEETERSEWRTLEASVRAGDHVSSAGGASSHAIRTQEATKHFPTEQPGGGSSDDDDQSARPDVDPDTCVAISERQPRRSSRP